MGKNLVRKTLTGSGNFVVPAGVKNVRVFGVVRTTPAINTIARCVGDVGSRPPSQMLRSDGVVLSSGLQGVSSDIHVTSGFLQASPTEKSFPGATIFEKVYSLGRSLTETRFWYLDEWGRAFGVGQGGGGLGNGITDAAVVTYPIMVAAASDKYFTKLHNSMGLCHDGSVFAWGNTSNGFSGTNVGGTLSTPTALAGGHSFIDIFGGSNWNGALKANGEVWTWGFNGQGQLGDNSVTTRSTPVQVAGGHSFISVAGSRDGVAAVRHDGLIYTWGRRAGTTAISTPTLLAGGQSFAKVCSGGLDNFFAIQADGTAYGWGTNETGVLGDSSTTARNTPVAVSGTHKFYDILGFGDNDGISCAFGVRRPQGDIYAWGSSRSSQGNGGVVGTSSPNPTLWGSGFAPVYSNQLLRELQTTPGETIAYDLTNPGAYNELIGRTLGVRYTSFVVEYFA